MKMKKRIVKELEIRRTEILNAAGELFKNQGYVNTTVEAVIRQVGIAKGTFYYYFKSKEDILDALVDETVSQVCADYKKIADDPELSAMDKMREMSMQTIIERSLGTAPGSFSFI